MTHHLIRPARLAGFLIVLIAGLVLVTSLQTAPLPGLGASSTDWFREVAPAAGLLAVLRLVVMIGLAYLLVATLLMLASMLLRASALDRLTMRCTGPTLRRFLRTSAGIGIGAVTSLQSLAAGAAPPLASEPPDQEPPATAEPTTEEVTTLTRVDEPEPTQAATEPQTNPPTSQPDPATTAPAAPSDTAATDWWTVAPGDHLWRIAEETLLDQQGETPSLEQTAAYWHVVCEANHDRLVDPDNPDLIVPGQQIVLPPVPAPSP